MTNPNEIEAANLLPCPFCGGEAKAGETLDNHWYVLCQRCEMMSSNHFDHKGGAIGAWNTRPAASARGVADGIERELARLPKGVSWSIGQMMGLPEQLRYRCFLSDHNTEDGKATRHLDCDKASPVEAIRAAIAEAESAWGYVSAPSSPAATPQVVDALPKHIGRLHLGERFSNGERLCADEHDIPAGHPMYWPEQISQYDDSDPRCLAHAIELSESDQGWCPCRMAATTPEDRTCNDGLQVAATPEVEREAHWASPLGGVQEALRIFRQSRKDVLAEKDRNTHLKGAYEPVIAAMDPALAELSTLEIALRTPPAPAGERGDAPSDATTAEAARRALGTWLAWPDAPRDGPVEVDNGKVCSWLQGVPAVLERERRARTTGFIAGRDAAVAEFALLGDAIRSARDFASGVTMIESEAHLAWARRDIGRIVAAIDAIRAIEPGEA